jgi:hypothetical protein
VLTAIIITNTKLHPLRTIIGFRKIRNLIGSIL